MHGSALWRPTPVLVAVSAMLAPHALAPAAQVSRPAWSFQATDSLRAVHITPLGSVAVRDGRRLSVLDLETGTAVWSRDGVRAMRFLPAAPFLLLDDSVVHVVRTDSGTTLWSFTEVPLHDQRHVWFVPEHDMLLASGWRGDSLVVTSIGLGGAAGGGSGGSGGVRWQRTDWLANTRHRQDVAVTQAPLVDSDTTFVTYPTRGGPIRVDARTGEILWRASALAAKAVPNLGDGYAPLLAGGGRIFVPYEQRIMALDQATGSAIWDQPVRGKSFVAHAEVTPYGLLIVGAPPRPIMDVIDIATGHFQWPSPFDHGKDTSYYAVQGDRVFVAIDRKLFAVRLDNGVEHIVLRVPFRGGEWPLLIEARPEGILLGGLQNLMLVTAGGGARYHAYFRAVGPSEGSKFAGLIGIAVINATIGMVAGELARGAGASWYVYPQINILPLLNQRYGAAVAAQSAYVMFTDDYGPSLPQGKPGFVRIDKATGEETGRVSIAEEAVTFLVDPFGRTVLVSADGRTLRALRFADR
jgi:outer membrane protein assembly factor BamB